MAQKKKAKSHKAAAPGMKVVYLTAHSQIDILEKQAWDASEIAAVYKDRAQELKRPN